MWELQTLLPYFHLSHPSMYRPALAHSGGPVAVQQRHATLEGQGSATLLRECKGGRTEGRKSARVAAARAGVTGASFLTLPLHEIGFGDIRIKRSVALPLPHRQASYNAKRVKSL